MQHRQSPQIVLEMCLNGTDFKVLYISPQPRFLNLLELISSLNLSKRSKERKKKEDFSLQSGRNVKLEKKKKMKKDEKKKFSSCRRCGEMPFCTVKLQKSEFGIVLK
ncbi:hypothetical protein CEXT_105591 [Caerostris extrusa]|uniref:Uncharacterized protein n=1 Tax=Caerostris extrusa TaxID=172846 RepID=A0AAV4R415_CAEEX|nr:hypothetical protein CEXT_105591 [Caerostris extrusa]